VFWPRTYGNWLTVQAELDTGGRFTGTPKDLIDALQKHKVEHTVLAQEVANEEWVMGNYFLVGSVPAGATAATLVVAYEPVWAIGTGKTPTTPEVAAAHAHIRGVLGGLTVDAAATRLLYGGSVNAKNAAELLAAGDVDGALVGGASLKADDFLAIAKAA
jgi:triosephosphate isomerase